MSLPDLVIWLIAAIVVAYGRIAVIWAIVFALCAMILWRLAVRELARRGTTP